MIGRLKNGAVKATATITIIIAISKIVGFIREMVLAAYFGQSVESDAYITAYGIINIFVLLFSAGIASTFIPIYTKNRVQNGQLNADRYASNILSLYILAGLAGGAIGYFAAPLFTSLIWHGKEGAELTTNLARIMFPALAFWATSGVLSNILNARQSFIPEQLMGFALSFSVILACTAFGSIESVAIATASSAVLQVIILIPFTFNKFRFYPHISFSDPNLGRTFVLAVPALISMAFDELNHQVDRVIGSAMQAGVVTSIAKSYTLVMTALGILVVPITTIMFSRLSQHAARRDYKRIISDFKRSVRILAMITLPIIAVCIVMSREIIALAYQHGNFTAADTDFTAPVFALYVLGLFTFGLRNFQTRVFYSLQETKKPMIIGIVAVIINILLDVALADPMGAPGLTLATTLASATAAILMLFSLRKMLGSLQLRSLAKSVASILVATGIAAFVMILLRDNMPSNGTILSTALRLVASAAGGAAAYLAALFLMSLIWGNKKEDAQTDVDYLE